MLENLTFLPHPQITYRARSAWVAIDQKGPAEQSPHGITPHGSATCGWNDDTQFVHTALLYVFLPIK